MSTSDFCFRTTARSLRKRIEKNLAMWEVGSIKQQKDDKNNRESLTIAFRVLLSFLSITYIVVRLSQHVHTHSLSNTRLTDALHDF